MQLDIEDSTENEKCHWRDLDLSFNLASIDPDWRPLVEVALRAMSPTYLNDLMTDTDWLPGKAAFLNAFKLPFSKTNYILLGESPYPRAESANGYAFWDQAVHDLWAPTGLSKPVNRATSLRHILKMLLVAEGKLSVQDTSQAAIAALPKTYFVQTLDALFQQLLDAGFLLLNTVLVYRKRQPVSREAKYWYPFLRELLKALSVQKPALTLIMLGNVAQKVQQIPAAAVFEQFCAQHPYNISFVTNSAVIEFFKPFHFLIKKD